MTLILIAIILGSVCLDQLTKWLAVIYLQGEPSFRLWPDVLHLTFVKNEGAAFGILSGHRWVFMLISTLAIVGLAVYLFRFCRLGNWVKVSLAMIIGGGIGNMIDRVMLGYVIDFIDFTLINFAVFNRYLFPGQMEGLFFSIFSIAIAAAETAVAIAIIVNIYRNMKNIEVKNLDELKD